MGIIEGYEFIIKVFPRVASPEICGEFEIRDPVTKVYSHVFSLEALGEEAKYWARERVERLKRELNL